MLDGRKRWIGGAVTADVLAVFARSTDDGQVRAFLVDRAAARGQRSRRFAARSRFGRCRIRSSPSTGVRVPESIAPPAHRFVARRRRLLRAMRSDVAWIATDPGRRLEAACAYVQQREQFGRPIGGFQLVQEKLARMLGNVTASLAMVVQLLEAGGRRRRLADEDSALAKMWTSLRAARPWPSPGRWSAAMESCSSTMSRGSSPTPKPSTPTRARTRSTPHRRTIPHRRLRHSPDPP